MEKERRNKYLKYLLRGILIFTGALLVWGALVEPNLLTVRHARVTLPGLPAELEGVRVLLVADTHFGSSWFEKLRRDRILKAAEAQKGDLIFLLGDYIAAGSLPRYGAMEEKELKHFFSSLKAPLGTYAILGNHELWYGRKKMSDLLESSGVRMIENKTVIIKDALTVTGIPEGSTVPFDRKAFSKRLAEEKPLILLTHKGDMVKYLTFPSSVLTFAADTHGGQVRLPGIGAPVSYQMKRKELSPGLSERWSKRIFVTTGAGGHRLNFRLFCPPEIALVTLTNGKLKQI